MTRCLAGALRFINGRLKGLVQLAAALGGGGRGVARHDDEHESGEKVRIASGSHAPRQSKRTAKPGRRVY